MPIMLPGKPDKNAWMKTLGEYIALGQKAQMDAQNKRKQATELLKLKEALSGKVGGVDVINLQTGGLEKLPNKNARIALKTKTHRLASAEELETMKQSVKRYAPPDIIQLQDYLSTLPEDSPKRPDIERGIARLTHIKQDSGVPTIGQAKAKIFQKWLNNEELTEKEEKVRRGLLGEMADAEKKKAKVLDSLKKRHDSLSRQVVSAMRGAGEVKEIFGDKGKTRAKLVAGLKDRLEQIENQIRAKGGDLRNLGIISIEETPEEEDNIKELPPPKKVLTLDMAERYTDLAGGDKNKGREMARKDGYTF